MYPPPQWVAGTATDCGATLTRARLVNRMGPPSNKIAIRVKSLHVFAPRPFARRAPKRRSRAAASVAPRLLNPGGGIHGPQRVTGVTRAGQAMEQHPHGVVVECDETIDRSPEVVWNVVACTGAVDWASDPSRSAACDGVRLIRLSPQMFMEQRVVDRREEVMVLRTAMTRSANLPWSAYESTIRVEAMPMDPSRCRVVLTCLATPTDDERIVTGLLHGLILLSLRSLKARVETT